jgi:hypothetical protein
MRLAALRDIVAHVLGRRHDGSVPDRAIGEGLFPADPAAPLVLVTAFGVPASGLDAALDRALAGRPSGIRVVCLTDQPDFAPLRRRGIAFEYLPGVGARSSDVADRRSWRGYLAERHDILIAKWRPDHVLAAGTSLEAFLA